MTHFVTRAIGLVIFMLGVFGWTGRQIGFDRAARSPPASHSIPAFQPFIRVARTRFTAGPICSTLGGSHDPCEGCKRQ